MLFAFYCRDKEGHGQQRLDNRAAHLNHLKSQGEKVLAAGPLISDVQLISKIVALVRYAGNPEPVRLDLESVGTVRPA